LAADTGAGADETPRADPDGPGERAAFADRLILRVRELGHPLCVGLDPQFASIPPLFTSAGGASAGGRPAAGPSAGVDPVVDASSGGTAREAQQAEAVLAFLSAVIERVAGRVAIVKPQIAFFEQLGWRGMRVLDVLCRRAREAGLLVLLDAKRGDIGSTAEGYAAAYLGRDAATPVDALTVNPYLGFDTLEPFVKAARANGCGLFVLVKTSNPGSGDLQDREVEGEPLFVRVAHGLVRSESLLLGAKTGWSSLGVVCGPTWPDQARRVREALPRALFLVPGYGAQGGSASAAVESFVAGPNGLEGGIVNSSRAILFPESAKGASDARAWERAFDANLDRVIDELGRAILK